MSDLTKVVQKLTETNKRLETLERQNAESSTPIERLKDALPEILSDRRESEKQRKQDKELAKASDDAEAGRDKVAGVQFDKAQDARVPVPGIIEDTSAKSDIIAIKQGDLIAENTKLQNMQLEAIRDPNNEGVKIQIQMQKEALGRVEDAITDLEQAMTAESENLLDTMPSLAVQEEMANEESQRRKEELASAFTPLKAGLGKIGEFFGGLKDRAKGGALTFLKAFGLAAGLGALIAFLESDFLKNLLSEENLKIIANGIKNLDDFFTMIKDYFFGTGEDKLTESSLLNKIAVIAAISGIASGIKLLREFLFPTNKELDKATRGAKLRGLLKFTLVAAAVAAVANGISEGFQRYKETGELDKAIIAGLAGVVNFLTFGLFGQDAIEKELNAVYDAIVELIKPFFKFLDKIGEKLFGAPDSELRVNKARKEVKAAQLQIDKQQARIDKVRLEKAGLLLKKEEDALSGSEESRLSKIDNQIKSLEEGLAKRVEVLNRNQEALDKLATPEVLEKMEEKRIEKELSQIQKVTGITSGELKELTGRNRPTAQQLLSLKSDVDAFGGMGGNVNVVNNRGGDTTTINKTISDVFVGNTLIAEKMLGSQ